MKLDPEVYLEAAQIIDESRRGFACNEIIRATGGYLPKNLFGELWELGPHLIAFEDMFKPDWATPGTAWLEERVEETASEEEISEAARLSREKRVVALLFMHEVVKEGGL